MQEKANTPFSFVYDSFLSKITDDMYMELDELDTYRILDGLLLAAINKFEFPRVSLSYTQEEITDVVNYCGVESDYEDVTAYLYNEGAFDSSLTQEEINILAIYMVVEWLGQQLASIENTRMKYSGTDFKFTSQANHMAKVLTLKKDWEREGFHMQRLYSRREVRDKGVYESTFDTIMIPLKPRKKKV